MREWSPSEKQEIRKRKRINDSKSWMWKLTFVGEKMSHNFYLYYLIDVIMESHPDLKGIIEIGTGRGALTTVLGLWGVKKNIPVLSIDRFQIHSGRIFRALNIQFIKSDFWDPWTIGMINLWIQKWGPLLLIIDGGNKKKEFNFWTPLLPAGSVIGVHDFGIELDYEDIKRVADSCCEKFNPRNWNKLNVQFAVFVKNGKID